MAITPTHPQLRAERLTLGYGDVDTVCADLDVRIPPGRITAIVGANACGKSTLLRALARLLRPRSGHVLLDGADLHSLATREVASRLGILPQSPTAPAGITVADLVARGRHPYRRLIRQWTPADDLAVARAMEATEVVSLASRQVDELSGGQRQRAWIALALAQETDILLLDEPTTYLDISHQIDVLDLLVDLNQEFGRTIVMVLHDFNQAARYADYLIAMKQGRIVAEGDPSLTITPEMIMTVLGLESEVVPDPVSGTPMVIPVGRHRVGARHLARVRPDAPSADNSEQEQHGQEI